MPAARELNPSRSLATFIGHKIRRGRESRGWRQEDLASKVFISRVRVTKIELGTDPPNPALAGRFDKVLGFEDELTNLSTVLMNSAMRDYAKTYLSRQLEAATMHDFSVVVPGLLQTEDYARAMMSVGLAGDTSEIERAVERRVARQQIWAREDPPWMWIILDAAVLSRATGGRSTMHGQLKKIREMIERPHINVQILPMNTTGIAGSTSLLTMPNGDRGAYTEGFLTGAYSEELSQVARVQRVYDQLRASALSADASGELIEKAIEEHT
ncbi:helix-turn-helix domain-containing protein [Streptomyces boncukensis]|uniref:Helix-turn-helix transcriptional regulator n=1 Tax=Streptomyces boncukensis TaxID=2711219 RepID=A0A6G4X3K9_9ACTN|nr:helix-turn-helix transcriptional regulator [Streptomyces boncukensis]NGO71324.1 helix-turn-helix transcriptional regulator [Streptomyces boncukensis]